MKCSSCHGFDHDTVSVHEPVCQTLNASSRTFDRVPVDVLEQWRRAGVPIWRCWNTNEGKHHWRGTIAIDALWSAVDLHRLAPKYVLPSIVASLGEKVLANEHARTALEVLALADDPPADHYTMAHKVGQVMAGLGIDTNFLDSARQWRRGQRV